MQLAEKDTTSLVNLLKNWTMKVKFENSRGYLIKMGYFFYLPICAHLIIMFRLMVKFDIPNKDNYRQYHTEIYKEEGGALSITALIVMGLILVFRYWYNTKLKSVLLEPTLRKKMERYYGVNIVFYILYNLSVIPIIYMYSIDGFVFYMALYLSAIFFILPLERPSNKRLYRNLRLKKEEREIIKNGELIP